MTNPCPACGLAETRPVAEFTSDTFGTPRRFEHRECPQCSMITVFPLPTPEEMAALYASPRYYGMTETETVLPDGTRDRPAWKVREYDCVLAGLARRAPPPGRLLDVGCGWGLFMECAKKAGYEPEGLDPSPAVTAYVRDRLGLPAHEARLEDVEPGRYAAVAMLDVLEHVLDPAEFARAARRALRPGGWLVIRVPNFDGFTNVTVPRILDRLRRRNPPVFLQHMSEFRKRSLRALLETAGFDAVAVEGSENATLHSGKAFHRRAAWKALGLLGAAAGRHCALLGWGRNPTGLVR